MSNAKNFRKTLKDGKLSFTRPQRYEHADAAAKLSDDLYELLPRMRIPQVLAEVDEWTGFSRCFTHQRTGELVDNPAVLYAVLLAEGINLSFAKMAVSCPSLKAESLLSVGNWFPREETYQNGLTELVNFHHRLPFAYYWGDGTTSASDGQFFQADKRAVLAEINKHYGFHPGVMFITHQSDQYQSYKIAAISPNDHQAPSMLDGLFHQHTDLKIREHYSDTGGYTQHVFAILHLAGFGYAPRIRDLNEKRLHCFDQGASFPTLAPWIGDQANLKRPERHWDEILRLITSLLTGVAKPSLVLKRLSAYERKNNLSSAIQDLGQIEQTLYMLTWFQDPILRYRVFAGMEKVERKHTMGRALCIYRHGIINDLSLEALLNRASGLNFLIMAIVVWNTVYLVHAVEALRSRGIEVPDHLLRHISPLAWDHINLIGDYTWDKLLPAPNTMRSLREDKIARLLKRKTAW